MATQMMQESDLVIVIRRKVRMTAFRRHRLIAGAVPEEDGFTQSGSRCNQGKRLIVRRGRSSIQHFDFVRSEQQDAVGHGFEIVEEPNVRDLETFRQHCAIDYPREVGRLAMVLNDGAGNTETGRLDFQRYLRWTLLFGFGSAVRVAWSARLSGLR